MLTTGESGIVPIDKEEYFTDCDPEFMSTFFCSVFGVDEPALKENPAPKNGGWAGMYYSGKELVVYNRRYTGLVMHELAHHIVHKIGENGDTSHGASFNKVLQEMHNLWR